MENVNAKMDEQLKARVDDLTRSNDENRDGKLDAADLKAQLNRIEAQLELQDRQNRGIIANQRKRMILSVVLVVVILAALAFFGWRMNVAYNNVMDACSRVNDLADTVNTSLATLDLPEITDQLKKIDVDALNNALTQLPALMDTVNSLQSQVQSIVNLFSGLSSVFGR